MAWSQIEKFAPRVVDWVDGATRIMAEDVENWQGRLSLLTDRLNMLGSDVQNRALAARRVTAGAGLTGGGDLNSDVTLSANVGNTQGTLAAGDDPRIVGAVQSSMLTEQVQDILGASLIGTGIDVTYDDTAGVVRLTVAANNAQAWTDIAFRTNSYVIRPDGGLNTPLPRVRLEGDVARLSGTLKIWNALSGNSYGFATVPPSVCPHTSYAQMTVSGLGSTNTVAPGVLTVTTAGDLLLYGSFPAGAKIYLDGITYALTP